MNTRWVCALLLALLPRPAAAADQPPGPPTEFQRNAAFFQARCAKCHTVGRGDRVGPDLKGLGARRPREWLLDFLQRTSWMLDNDAEAKALLQKFNGVRMEDVSLTRAQAEGLLDYVEEAAKGPVGPEEPPEPEEEALELKLRMPEERLRVWLPGAAGVLVLAAVGVIAWQLGAQGGSALLAVLALALGYWSFGGRARHRLLGNQQGYSPVQPIAFSHRVHAGTLKVDCFYCHFGAERSDAAGVPPAQVCMNCHKTVRNASGWSTPSPEIATLVAAWEGRGRPDAQPIQWLRVHRLPDYVHFPHRVHVANNIRCQECHGPVQDMDRMRQAATLSMGWCVNCHRHKPGSAPTHWKRSEGPLDCAACHW